MDLMSLTIIIVLIMVIVICVAYIVITAPVASPYFSASMSKNKYALIMVNKNGTMTLSPAKFRNGRAVLKNGLSKFLKMGLHGSYSLGNIRCDIVHSEVATMMEDSTLSVFNELEKAGINDIGELTKRANQAALIQLGLVDKKELSQHELDIIKLRSDYIINNMRLLSPVVKELNVHDAMKNSIVDPVTLMADSEEHAALIAKQYRTLWMGKKNLDNDNGDMMKFVAIGGVALLVVGLAVTFFMM